MKKDFFNKIASLKEVNGKLSGGFATLNTKQLAWLMGGSNPGKCTNNEFCGATNSGHCTNIASCIGSNTGACSDERGCSLSPSDSVGAV